MTFSSVFLVVMDLNALHCWSTAAALTTMIAASNSSCSKTYNGILNDQRRKDAGKLQTTDHLLLLLCQSDHSQHVVERHKRLILTLSEGKLASTSTAAVYFAIFSSSKPRVYDLLPPNATKAVTLTGS